MGGDYGRVNEAMRADNTGWMARARSTARLTNAKNVLQDTLGLRVSVPWRMRGRSVYTVSGNVGATTLSSLVWCYAIAELKRGASSEKGRGRPFSS